MKEAVQKALSVMSEVEGWLRLVGMREHTGPETAFTCGLKAGRLESARAALRLHEERSERARAAAAKARRSS